MSKDKSNEEEFLNSYLVLAGIFSGIDGGRRLRGPIDKTLRETVERELPQGFFRELVSTNLIKYVGTISDIFALDGRITIWRRENIFEVSRKKGFEEIISSANFKNRELDYLKGIGKKISSRYLL